jgi:hypothetical protein
MQVSDNFLYAILLLIAASMISCSHPAPKMTKCKHPIFGLQDCQAEDELESPIQPTKINNPEGNP